ncbi:hypothetical protein MML61_23750 [Mycobacterium marinum]|uniref:hypothetical protein n=1 Tax=Mycobacterium marinum TaxID=1781 RepID=UPI002359BB07|nr:hypothetical protein [Mycobacterium marinum]WCS17760.1 hypothetical protein MML61_23750 [Mycobacterium marinum]
MARDRERLRYAFAITRGKNAGLGCGGWRIWTHCEDTYIAAKGNPWKASLHADESWRVAVTSEHVASGKLPVVPGGRATSWEFEPTVFSGGGRLAFAVAVTRNALVQLDIDPQETVIEVADRWDRLTLLYLWMTEAGVTLESPGPILGGPLPLSSGRRVWVTAGEENIASCEPVPVPAGQIVMLKSPGEDDVASPGFLVCGLNIP